MPILPAAPWPHRDPAQRERRDVFRRILVVYDGSPGPRVALKRGIELAKVLGSELVSVSVEEHPPSYATSISEVKATKEQIDEHFRSLTKQARDLAALSGVETETLVQHGHEVERIVATAKEFDLLIIGYHGHSRILERAVGSTAQSVRDAPCPVLVAK
jgi:nucleotide-binding universal stress UspA family protein